MILSKSPDREPDKAKGKVPGYPVEPGTFKNFINLIYSLGFNLA